MSLSRSLLSVAALASFVPSSSVLAEEPTTLQPVEEQQLTTNGNCSATIDSYSVSGLDVNVSFTVGCISTGFQAYLDCGDGGIPGSISRFPGTYSFDMVCKYTRSGTRTITVTIPGVVSDSVVVSL